jgi:hypothetical protein
MKILTHQQGSTEWIISRLFRLTASNAAKFFTTKGVLSDSIAMREKVDNLIAGYSLGQLIQSGEVILPADDRELQELIAHYTGDAFRGTLHTRRGHECEPLAIAALQERIGAEITSVGMVVHDNNFTSCSPDGLVMDGEKIIAGAEVKAPSLGNYYGQIREGGLPPQYRLQVHLSMAICEVDAWHFGSFFKGHPIHYVRVEREKLTDTLAENIDKFAQIYSEQYTKTMAAVDAAKL